MKYDFKPQLQRELTADESAAISSSIDNMSGYVAASNTSRKQRKFIQDMYELQKKDNLANWERENSYNSPKAQMDRLKQAGLNPNLVYGNGADAQGGSISQANPQSWNPDVPPTNFGSHMMTQMGIQMQQLQMENLKAQNELINAQTNNVNASTLNRGMDTANKSFAHRFNLNNERLMVDTKEAELHNINVQGDKGINEIALSRNRDYREAILNATTVKEAAARMAEIYARINKLMPAQINEINARIANMEKDGRLKDYEADLNSIGVQKGDSFLWRTFASLAQAIFNGIF